MYLLAVLLVSTYWGLVARARSPRSRARRRSTGSTSRPPGGSRRRQPELGRARGVPRRGRDRFDGRRGRARRADEAELLRRREEADLAADMARRCSGRAAPRRAGARVGGGSPAALDLASATRAGPGGGRRAPRRRVRSTSARAGGGARRAGRHRARAAARQGADRAVARGAAGRGARPRGLQAEVVETQALRRSDVIKTALLRAVSHDLRSPLTAIITAGDAVRSPRSRPAEREELGVGRHGEAARLSRLVDKLLDLSRLQAGAAEPRETGARSRRSSRPRWPTSRRRTGRPSASRSTATCRSSRRRRAARAGVRQPARERAPLLRRRPVQVRARVSGGRLSMRVVDRGPGIPPELLPNVFEPF